MPGPTSPTSVPLTEKTIDHSGSNGQSPRKRRSRPRGRPRQTGSGPSTGMFTDGSCEGNPGPGGWAFVWVEDDRIVVEENGCEPDTTNNRMELRALIEAYRYLPEDARTTVYSDSELCVKTMNEWAVRWEQRGWRRKSGAIKNLDLVQELYALVNSHTGVELRWIRAHAGSRWNEYVDALASGYLREGRG